MKIIIIACVLTALLVGIFTLSQGTTKFGKKDGYMSDAATKEESSRKENVDPYSIVRISGDEDEFTVLAYQNKELTDNEIKSLVNDVKKENKDMSSNYKINVYSEETVVESDDKTKLKLVIESVGEDKISINKRHFDVDNKLVEVPDYTSISIKNIYDEEDDNNTLKTKIDVIMLGEYSPQEALSNIKAIGNYTKGIKNTYDILNIIAYTSDDKNEYWEYSGHFKNDIIYARVIDL